MTRQEFHKHAIKEMSTGLMECKRLHLHYKNTIKSSMQKLSVNGQTFARVGSNSSKIAE